MLRWKGSMGITQSSSCPCTGHPRSSSLCLAVQALLACRQAWRCLEQAQFEQFWVKTAQRWLHVLLVPCTRYLFLSHSHRLSRIISLIFKYFPMLFLNSKMNKSKQRQTKTKIFQSEIIILSPYCREEFWGGLLMVCLTVLGGFLPPYFLWPAKLWSVQDCWSYLWCISSAQPRRGSDCQSLEECSTPPNLT